MIQHGILDLEAIYEMLGPEDSVIIDDAEKKWSGRIKNNFMHVEMILKTTTISIAALIIYCSIPKKTRQTRPEKFSQLSSSSSRISSIPSSPLSSASLSSGAVLAILGSSLMGPAADSDLRFVGN